MQIRRKSVDESRAIPTCQLAIDWKGQCGIELPVFKHRVNLLGAKAPNNFFILRICPPPSPLPIAVATSATSAAPAASASNAAGQAERVTLLSASMIYYVSKLCLHVHNKHALLNTITANLKIFDRAHHYIPSI